MCVSAKRPGIPTRVNGDYNPATWYQTRVVPDVSMGQSCHLCRERIDYGKYLRDRGADRTAELWAAIRHDSIAAFAAKYPATVTPRAPG